MNVEECGQHLKNVDRNILKGTEVPEADLSIDLSDLYVRYKWGGPEASPIPMEVLKNLELDDRTSDKRWVAFFRGSHRDLAVYRTTVGYYWLLSWSANKHHLTHCGTAADVVERFGEK